jgi:hypothetical protein
MVYGGISMCLPLLASSGPIMMYTRPVHVGCVCNRCTFTVNTPSSLSEIMRLCIVRLQLICTLAVFWARLDMQIA